MSATVKAVTLLAAGQAATGVISAHVVALSKGVLITMFLTKFKLISTAVLIVSLTGVGLATYPGGTTSQKEAGGVTNEAKAVPVAGQQLRIEPVPGTQLQRYSTSVDDADPKKGATKSTYLVKVSSQLDGFVKYINLKKRGCGRDRAGIGRTG